MLLQGFDGRVKAAFMRRGRRVPAFRQARYKCIDYLFSFAFWKVYILKVLAEYKTAFIKRPKGFER